MVFLGLDGCTYPLKTRVFAGDLYRVAPHLVNLLNSGESKVTDLKRGVPPYKPPLKTNCLILRARGRTKMVASRRVKDLNRVTWSLGGGASPDSLGCT